jgi:F-type H+-transporting ATPase subunit delta
MGAATRASTSAGVDALLAVKRPVADLGDQLLAAARTVASSHQLVTTLADPGIPADQRAALAKRVLPNLSAQAQTLVAVLVGGRWSVSDDLVGAIEDLGFRALATSRGGEDLESELFAVLQAVGSDGRVELALGGQSTPVEARLALVDRLLRDAKPATRTIVQHVVLLPRGRKPVEALEHAQSVVAGARDQLVAVVQTAQRLSPIQVSDLAARLATGYGRKIAVNQVVDPALLGGVRITIGDDVIDGTVRARLDDLRLRIAG